MNSSQLSISRSLDEFFTPTPITYLSFSFKFLVLGVDDADRNVLEVDEQSDSSFCLHSSWWCRTSEVCFLGRIGFEEWLARHPAVGGTLSLEVRLSVTEWL